MVLARRRVLNDPAQILLAQRTVGNRGTRSILTVGGQQPVVQRMLEDETKAETRIKIWRNGEVVEVYLANDFFEGATWVSYYEDKPSANASKGSKKRGNQPKPKPKPKPKRIAAEFAFERTKSNKDIAEEMAQEEESKTLEHPEHGELTIPAEVVNYLTQLAEKYREDLDLEVELTPARVRIAAAATGSLAMYLARGLKTDPLEEIRDLLESPGGEHYMEEFIDQLRGTGSQRETPSSGDSSSSGKSNEEWKSKKTDRLKGALIAALKEADGADKLLGGSTLHHKLSRARVKEMLKILDTAPPGTAGVQEMDTFIQQVKNLTGRSTPEDALCNWAANIELGVLVEKRDKDPGMEFDGSYLNGVATPRTRYLEEVAVLLMSPNLTSHKLWLEIAQNLAQAQAEHAKIATTQARGADDLTRPRLEMWQPTGEGTYSRTKKA